MGTGRQIKRLFCWATAASFIQTITLSVVFRLQCWAAQLTSFNFEIKYRSGRRNRNADALSRQHPPGSTDMEAMLPGTSLPALPEQVLRKDCSIVTAVVTVLPPNTLSDMKALQQTDPFIQEVWKYWDQSRRPNVRTFILCPCSDTPMGTTRGTR